ncbi:demethylmenaquinone methyltransferase-like [Hydractinia symbiolongicarpus]|uniref:demethylmenaquinone methyltransferase-like n=1 Tax=Hydractinia symbiolongicarpus TaxID=13093 RepID=UPI00254B8277|nr:demethylmenaquinone methyltransferase-like [Hydractinia symbiolongicarpus]
MLEAGCGTGNYSLALLQNGIGKLTLLDASEGMLAKAKSKLSKHEDRLIEVKQHALPEIPFADGTFDACTFIQVLHHLDTVRKEEEVSNHINLKKALVEAHRVLKSGGVLLIDSYFRENLNGFCTGLAPKTNAYLKKLYIDEEMLISFLKENGFVNMSCISRPGCTIYKDNFKIENILDPVWRGCDSSWQILEENGELDSVLKLVQKHKDEGTLEQLERQFKRVNDKVGNHTMLFAQKL